MSTREQYIERGKEYYRRYYGQLEGATIVKYLGEKDEDDYNDGFPTLLVRFPDTDTVRGAEYEIQVSRDPEGNGGGFLFLPYEPSMDDYDKEHKLNNYSEDGHLVGRHA
jgi:hypothetical protein